MPLKEGWVGALMYNGGATFDKVRFWNNMVLSTYCDKNLTYDSDLLVALAGVARRFASPELGRYLGGLWENCLAYSLLWESEDYLGQRIVHRTGLFPGGAPTFTWASRVGPIRWRYSSDSRTDSATDRFDDCAPPPLLISILDVKCDLGSADPYGKVVGGYLRVSGMLAQGHLVKTERGGRLGRVALGLAFAVLFPNDDERLELTLDSSEDMELVDGTTVYCLPVVGSCRRGDRTVGGQYDALVQVGLCLRRTEQDDGNFRRIGVFYSSVGQKSLAAAERREVGIV